MRDRDVLDERALTSLACQAARLPAHVADTLSAFAESRTRPGGVDDRDFMIEIREEIADARNYAAWGAQQARAAVAAGVDGADDDYARCLTVLEHLEAAWQHTTDGVPR